jgi:hypothetical protein
VDQPVVGGGQGKIECLSTDQLYSFCGFDIRKRK